MYIVKEIVCGGCKSDAVYTALPVSRREPDN